LARETCRTRPASPTPAARRAIRTEGVITVSVQIRSEMAALRNEPVIKPEAATPGPSAAITR